MFASVCIEQQNTNPGFDCLIVDFCFEFGLHNLLHKLRASVEGDFAPDAGEVPDVFVVAAKAPQVQKDAIHPGQFCCFIPTVVLILHGLCPFVKFSVFPFFSSFAASGIL